jgi:hypothetical protein
VSHELARRSQREASAFTYLIQGKSAVTVVGRIIEALLAVNVAVSFILGARQRRHRSARW